MIRRKFHKLLLSATAICFIACIVSCSRKPAKFSDFAEIPNNGWAYGDTVMLLSGFPDTISSGNLRVAVDYADDYLYSNLWLEICYQRRKYGSVAVVRDTVEMLLCDTVGNRNGMGAASNYQIEMTVGHIDSLDTRTRIGVRHIMRTDTLRGLNRIGLFLDEDNSK